MAARAETDTPEKGSGVRAYRLTTPNLELTGAGLKRRGLMPMPLTLDFVERARSEPVRAPANPTDTPHGYDQPHPYT